MLRGNLNERKMLLVTKLWTSSLISEITLCITAAAFKCHVLFSAESAESVVRTRGSYNSVSFQFCDLCVHEVHKILINASEIKESGK